MNGICCDVQWASLCREVQFYNFHNHVITIIVEPTDEPQCELSFTRRRGTSADGGQKQSGVDTLDECKDRCEDQDSGNDICYGFDWVDTNEACWIHYDETNLDKDKSNSNSDQYIIKRCEDPSPDGKNSNLWLHWL